jgi:hypothetical protein
MSHIIHYNHYITVFMLRKTVNSRSNNTWVAVVLIWPNSHFRNHQSTCGIWGSHSNVVEDSFNLLPSDRTSHLRRTKSSLLEFFSKNTRPMSNIASLCGNHILYLVHIPAGLFTFPIWEAIQYWKDLRQKGYVGKEWINLALYRD